jgi:serine phosphatase RsbU (regulator of sigma subunit)
MGYNITLINHSNNELTYHNLVLSSAFPDYSIFQIQNFTNLQHQITSCAPDLIILDLDNQSTNGISILSDISSWVKVPIIAISEKNNMDEIYNMGAVFFLQKPFSDIQLVSSIKTAIKFIANYKSLELNQKEIEIKNKHIEWQHDNVLKQRDIITQKNNEIMADMRYASRIQQAIFPNLDSFSELINNYFLLHLPKSHISGDFYWITKHNDKLIIAIGDCTGHGVSGALMHMLGNVFLNNIITESKFNSASDIIEQLRSKIMTLLNQKGEMGETQDGMDIALCILDFDTMIMEFAGANNPLYFVRNKELIEYKGDRMPVGIHINFNKPFTNQKVELKSNDVIYLFSDGFADQFGGESGKKFRYKRFQELLVEINELPMNKQKEKLETVFINWRGSLDQIDDVLVFGFKIK